LAGQHSIPTIYERREYIDAGGLISYGADFANAFRETGIYTARVLKGAMPADLPVLLPTKFELIINLKTAEALRLTIPRRLRLSADRVIE